jgi:hypothetical protein
MYFRALIALVAVNTVSALGDEAQTDLHFAELDWDDVEKHGGHEIQMDSKDFTNENPHVEQAIIDEGKRETGELELDRSHFVKDMADMRTKVFAQVDAGHLHDIKAHFKPQLRKIDLR